MGLPPSLAAAATGSALNALQIGSNTKVVWNTDQPRTYTTLRPAESSVSDDEAIFDHRVALKMLTSSVAMHLDEAWRTGMFRQLDGLLHVDDWDFSDKLPSPESFKTFLRMIVHNRPAKRPGLGATADGRIVAAWTSGPDRLTVECTPDDQVKWVAVAHIGGEPVRGALTSPVQHLRKFLAPFGPERWFG